MEKADIIIVGSGAIALAAALFFKDLKIALISTRPSDITSTPVRLFALAKESCNLLQKIGLSDQVFEEAQAINQIRVVDHDTCSKVDFLPSSLNLDNFGFFLDESTLTRKLFHKVEELGIEIIQPQDYDIQPKPYCSEVTIQGRTIATSLLLVAEGKESALRKKLGINVKIHDYKETAMVLDISHKNWPHRGIAVEKFTPSGPFAILPKSQGGGTESSLVWVEKGFISQEEINLLEREKIHQLVARKLNGYLHPFEIISEVKTFPLKLIQATNRYKDRIVLVGDAAQAIHPLAGQGFNLGLRDLQSLSNLVLEQKRLGLDLASVLPNYSKSRNFDVELMIGFTSSLTKIFSNDILPLKLLRRGGLRLFDSCEFAKKFFIKYACGL